VTLDGRDTSFLEWVGAVSPALARPGGAMHEVASSPLISEIRVGLAAHALCLRLSGDRLADQIASGSASVALVVAGPEVRILAVDRSWIAAGSITEIQVPFDRIGLAPGADLQFAIQVRDRDDAILEAVPHGRFWTIAIPVVGAINGDWQA
jgi:hypothetical protein